LAEARGGQSGDTQPSVQHKPDASFDQDQQQKEQAEKLKREQLRQKLHREINPVEAHDVYNAREQQVKKEIESIRYELRMLSQEVVSFEKEVELTLSTNVAEPGQTGIYFINFFQQLRSLIQLLRQKVHSAHTWATAMSGKKKKMGNKPGMEISGKSYEQTTTVFDRMHHERSTAYAGS
jgi:hypothetical protein